MSVTSRHGRYHFEKEDEIAWIGEMKFQITSSESKRSIMFYGIMAIL